VSTASGGARTSSASVKSASPEISQPARTQQLLGRGRRLAEVVRDDPRGSEPPRDRERRRSQLDLRRRPRTARSADSPTPANRTEASTTAVKAQRRSAVQQRRQRPREVTRTVIAADFTSIFLRFDSSAIAQSPVRRPRQHRRAPATRWSRRVLRDPLSCQRYAVFSGRRVLDRSRPGARSGGPGRRVRWGTHRTGDGDRIRTAIECVLAP